MILRTAWIVLLLMLVALVCGQDVGLVKEIKVAGNVHVSQVAILTSMSTKVGSQYSQAKLDADRQTLSDLGYFASVDVRGVPLADGWSVQVQVVEFPMIKEIAITGNTVIPTESIQKVLSGSVKVGSVFNARDRDPNVKAIEKLYSDKGYFAQVTNFSPSPDSAGTLDIQILEVKVGTISVSGNKLTKDWVMRRLIKTRSGDVFNVSKWTKDLTRLYNTQWFESVRHFEDDQRQLGYIDLTADVKEQRTGTFNVGLSLDPEQSLAGIIHFSEANVGGTGQTVGIDFTQAITGGGPSVVLDYSNPFIDSQDTVFHASVYSRLVYRFSGNLFGGSGTPFTNNSVYDERHTGVSFGFSRPVTPDTIGAISIKAEYVDTENLANLIDNQGTPNDPTDWLMTDNFIQQDGFVTSLGLQSTTNRRDVDIDPSRGDFFQLSLEPGYSDITKVGGLTTGTDILGPHLWGKATADYRVYWTPEKPRGSNFDAPRKVVAFRVRYGTTAGQIPFFEQYFAGGSDTLRGYPDDRFWGRNTLLTNVELRYPIQKSFSLIGFVDYGGAWGGYGTIQSYTQNPNFALHLGYGPGISFRTPLGNIQLFLGFNQQGGTQTHFLIGNSF